MTLNISARFRRPGTASAGMVTTPLTSTSKPQDVRKLKAWGLKQVTIGAIVGLSQGPGLSDSVSGPLTVMGCIFSTFS